MTVQESREVAFAAVVQTVKALRCSRCGQLFYGPKALDAAAAHIAKWQNGRWQGWQRPLTPMQRDDGIVHLGGLSLGGRSKPHLASHLRR